MFSRRSRSPGLIAFLIWHSGAWSIAAWLLIVPLELALAGSRLLKGEAENYRLLTQSMTDVISRHSRNGAVTFISPAAAKLFSAAPAELMGRGLFDRVHVADRPAYLKRAGGRCCRAGALARVSGPRRSIRPASSYLG